MIRHLSPSTCTGERCGHADCVLTRRQHPLAVAQADARSVCACAFLRTMTCDRPARRAGPRGVQRCCCERGSLVHPRALWIARAASLPSQVVAPLAVGAGRAATPSSPRSRSSLGRGTPRSRLCLVGMSCTPSRNNKRHLPRRATRLSVSLRWPARAKTGKTASALRIADLRLTDSTCSSSSATWNDVRFELKHRARMGAT